METTKYKAFKYAAILSLLIMILLFSVACIEAYRGNVYTGFTCWDYAQAGFAAAAFFLYFTHMKKKTLENE